MKDEDVKDNVIDELIWEPSVDAERIDVEVENGEVSLSGVVHSYYEKFTAGEAAERLLGVRSVRNELEVELEKAFEREDAEIAEAARNALTWNTTVSEKDINVDVENGQVTLTGEVEWNYQKRAAVNAVKFLSGVQGVTNNIAVKPSKEPASAQEKILRALERDALIDADQITVSVEGSEAILGGTASSWMEKRRAEEAAWSTPGILTIRNRIVVGSPEGAR